jgi:hypothetical protein
MGHLGLAFCVRLVIALLLLPAQNKAWLADGIIPYLNIYYCNTWLHRKAALIALAVRSLILAYAI